MSDRIGLDEGLFYTFLLVWTFILTSAWYSFLSMIFNPTALLEKAVIGLLAAIAGFFMAILSITVIYKDCRVV